MLRGTETRPPQYPNKEIIVDTLDTEKGIAALCKEGKIILSIRAKIPELRSSCEGCGGRCCGIVPFSRWEWEQIADKRRAISTSCPYLEDGQCAIYDKRPIICRLFGQPNARRTLKCRHGGCRVVGKALTPAQIERIWQRYKRLIDGAGKYYGPFADVFDIIHLHQR